MFISRGKMCIRKAKPNEIRELASVYVKAFSAVDCSEDWDIESARKLLEFYMTHQADLVFLAEQDGLVAGGITGLIKTWWNGNHLIEPELFVDPDYQKLGFGRKLFLSLLKEARDKYSARYVEAVTFRNIAFPLSWYQSLDFKESQELVFLSGNVNSMISQLNR